MRPGGGVAVLYNRRSWWEDEEPWLREIHATFEEHRLPPGDVDPWNTEPWKAALGARFGELVEEELENVQRSSADELLAQYASFSAIGGLPPERRDAALAALGEVLSATGSARRRSRTGPSWSRLQRRLRPAEPDEVDARPAAQAAAASSARRQRTRARWRL